MSALEHDLTTVDPHAEAVAADASVLRAAALGAVVGFVVLTIAISLGGIAGGLERSSAIGLGTFVGAWAGAGFGFMMGATLTIARHHDHA